MSRKKSLVAFEQEQYGLHTYVSDFAYVCIKQEMMGEAPQLVMLTPDQVDGLIQRLTAAKSVAIQMQEDAK